MNDSIGEYLEKLRLSCGYSLRLASRKTSLSHGYIRDVELGKRSFPHYELIPKPDTLKKFALGYKTSFNELMRIAGHIDSEPLNEFEFIDLDFNKVQFIQIDFNDTLIYHSSQNTFVEFKSLFEFSLFESLLENNGYIRIKSGLYVNLKMVKRFDKISGEISFFDENEDKQITVPRKLSISIKSEITRAAEQNTIRSYDFTNEPFIRTIRNLFNH